MNPARLNPAWVVPTARATAWTPLAIVAAAMIGVASVGAVTGSRLDLLGVTGAALAAAAVAGLRDPAAGLLAAVPVSPAWRRAHRLVLLVPAVLVVWLACLGLPVGPALALTAFGVAVCVWAPRRAAVVLGAAAPAFWVLASTATTALLGSPDGWKDDLVYAWNDRPWTVTALAVTAIAARRSR